MNIARWLSQAGRDSASAPAMRLGAAQVSTYSEFSDRAARLGAGLLDEHRLLAGDRVGIVAKNEPAYLEAMFGVWWAGLVVVPINAKLHPNEVDWILADAGASVVFASADLEGALTATDLGGASELFVLGSSAHERLVRAATPRAPVDRAPEDPAWLFYTSGTTGRPKGAVLSHRNLAAMSLAHLAEIDPTGPDDCLVHAAPMSHGSGLYSMSHVCRRAANVFPESAGFEAEEVLELTRRLPGISMFAAPTMIQRLTDAAGDGSFRSLIWGGAPMHPSRAVAAIDRFGPCLAQIYGQGESPMTITHLSKQAIGDCEREDLPRILSTAGIPYSVVEVEVRDEEGRALDPGGVGEVVVRGETVMSGYWRNPTATSSALRDGWLHTGDIGSIDETGLLTLKDRAKDLIISGGTNIYPREVEDVLLTHPAVQEVAVVGVPEDEWGEVVVAFVVTVADSEELDRHCLTEMARFKRPKRYVHLDSLPKNGTGKVLRRELRSQAVGS